MRKAHLITTGFLVLAMLIAGVQDVRHAPELLEALERLGYPPYHLTIIGVAKLVGAPLLLVPGYPRLREWVYAGFAFDFFGAIAAHVAAGDTFEQTAPALFCALLVTVSYVTYRLSEPGAGFGKIEEGAPS